MAPENSSTTKMWSISPAAFTNTLWNVNKIEWAMHNKFLFLLGKWGA